MSNARYSSGISNDKGNKPTNTDLVAFLFKECCVRDCNTKSHHSYHICFEIWLNKSSCMNVQELNCARPSFNKNWRLLRIARTNAYFYTKKGKQQQDSKDFNYETTSCKLAACQPFGTQGTRLVKSEKPLISIFDDIPFISIRVLLEAC